MPTCFRRSITRSIPRRSLCVAAVALALLGTGWAMAASSSVADLSVKLLQHDDFRVRTQAALALGATGSESAVKPLCRGLSDKSTTVRAAAAAGLGKLMKGGEECLRQRLGREAKVSVRTAIRKTLDKFEEAAGGKITAGTRYYVSIAGVTDPSGKEMGDLHTLVRHAMAAAVGDRDDIAFAPPGEPADVGRQRLKGRDDIRGFYLAPKVTPAQFSDGNLTVRVEIAIFTYPTKVLKGMLPVKLTEQGVASATREREENLLQMAAARAMEKFASQVESIR